MRQAPVLEAFLLLFLLQWQDLAPSVHHHHRSPKRKKKKKSTHSFHAFAERVGLQGTSIGILLSLFGVGSKLNSQILSRYRRQGLPPPPRRLPRHRLTGRSRTATPCSRTAAPSACEPKQPGYTKSGVRQGAGGYEKNNPLR